MKIPSFILLIQSPKNIEVDTEELENYTPTIYQSYRPFFTTEGIYSGQGHFLKIPASVINLQDLKEVVPKMIPCDMITKFLGRSLGIGCGQSIKGSISFLYKPLYDTENSKKIRILFSLNNFKEGKVSALNVVPFVSRKFWEDHFPILKNLSIGAPAWVWQSYAVGFYFVASINTTEDKELLNTAKWTHIKLVFDTSNYQNVNEGAKIFINGKDASTHIGFRTEFPITTGIFGVPDYFTNNYLRFGESYKQNAWNFPQDAIYNRIKISKDINPPSKEELILQDTKQEMTFILPIQSTRAFISYIYVENFSRLPLTVSILDEKGKIISTARGIDIVNLNTWVDSTQRIKIKIEPLNDGIPIITGIVIGTLKNSAEFLEFSRPQ
jgi:hypothetical protein